jgi:hypothetical protein
MFAQDQEIRRRDGMIDIDFYRQKGLMERRIVMTQFFRRLKRICKPVVAAAALAGALYAAPARDGTGWNGPTSSPSRLDTASLVDPVEPDHPGFNGQNSAISGTPATSTMIESGRPSRQ